MGWKPTEKVPTSFPGKYEAALLTFAVVLEALTYVSAVFHAHSAKQGEGRAVRV